MDLLNNLMGLGTAFTSTTDDSIASRANPWVTSLFRSLDAPAYANLTSDYMTQHFNPSTPDDPNVLYFSYGASKEPAPYRLLRVTWNLVKEKEGVNDGVVSVFSSRWGEYVGTVPVDHFSLTKYTDTSALPHPSFFSHLHHYFPTLSSLSPTVTTLLQQYARSSLPALRRAFSELARKHRDPAQALAISHHLKSYQDRLKALAEASYYDSYIYGFDDAFLAENSDPLSCATTSRPLDTAQLYSSISTRLQRLGM